jgi:hypothetical protein
MIPLYCSEVSGISYIETANLDGEKNLKPKISLPEIQLAHNQQEELLLNNANIKIVCDMPNADINGFMGRICIKYK